MVCQGIVALLAVVAATVAVAQSVMTRKGFKKYALWLLLVTVAYEAVVGLIVQNLGVAMLVCVAAMYCDAIPLAVSVMKEAVGAYFIWLVFVAVVWSCFVLYGGFAAITY